MAGGPAQLHVPPASTGFSRDYRDDVAERLLTLKDGLVHPDPAILFHTCHSIAQVPARHPQREAAVWAERDLRSPLHQGPGRALDGVRHRAVGLGTGMEHLAPVGSWGLRDWATAPGT